MTEPARGGLSTEQVAHLSRLVMRRQAGLSLRVAAIFLAMLLGLPLVSALAPGLAAYPIYGIPANWLFLAVLFYPITVALAVAFVRRSDAIEGECKSLMADSGEASP